MGDEAYLLDKGYSRDGLFGFRCCGLVFFAWRVVGAGFADFDDVFALHFYVDGVVGCGTC